MSGSPCEDADMPAAEDVPAAVPAAEDMSAAEDVPAADDALTLDSLPMECLIECLATLEPNDLHNTACVSVALAEAASADYLWRGLCVREQHGASLEFKEMLGSFSHPDALRSSSGKSAPAAAAGVPWRDVYHLSRESLRTTICIDSGRGYAKYGLALSEAPSIVQICQPGAEATQETLFPTAFRRLGLRRADMGSLSVIISEPFRLSAAECERERVAWRYETERRILQGYQLKRLAIVDSASLCLFANKLTSGVVINIGFATTFVVPVLRGHVIRSAVRTLRLGGSAFTQLFHRMLLARGVDCSWRPEFGGEEIMDITVARNLKELACEVSPTPLRQLCPPSQHGFNVGDVLSLPNQDMAEVTMGSVPLAFGYERFLPGEVLFEQGGGGDGGGGASASPHSLQALTLAAVDATVALEQSGALSAEVAGGLAGRGSDDSPSRRHQRPTPAAKSLREGLLGRIVVSGGSSNMKGLTERLRFEIAALIDAEGSSSSSPSASSKAVHVRPSVSGDHMTWLGASMLAGTSTFGKYWCVHAPTAPEGEGAMESEESDGMSDERGDEGPMGVMQMLYGEAGSSSEGEEEEEEEEEGEEEDDEEGEGAHEGGASPVGMVDVD